jgi:hypothetical protein
MPKKISLQSSSNKLNIKSFLSPENVFPQYPAGKEKQMDDLYSHYSKHSNLSLSKVSFLNELMTIRDGLGQQREIVKENSDHFLDLVKEDISRSHLSDDQKNELLQELEYYLSIYSLGEYNLDVYENLISKIVDCLLSYDSFKKESQVGIMRIFYEALFASVDAISRIDEHISLLSLIIGDIIDSNYKYDVPDLMTDEQKERLKLSQNNEPPTPAQNKQWVINKWNELRPSYPESVGDSACAREVKRIYEETFDGADISESHIKRFNKPEYNR